ncbi:hypothetical protein KEJ50_00545 [Candidatus Bathyarchaeota archaeon]|nr:hypothetical protein [Candidatus Bathyarchaeota archaeon]
MSKLKLNLKIICVAALVTISLLSVINSVSAAYNGKIIPPNPYTVYTNQVYSLTVAFHYMAATPCAFWIESPPYHSGKVMLTGSGTTAVALMLQAPSTPGVYTLGLKLYLQPQGQTPMLVDTATVQYQVIEPIKTDWDIEKVWIEPSAPVEDEQVTFHARIALRSTNSKHSLTVGVACLLDNKLYSSESLTFSPQPSFQDITVQKTWIATKGSHTLVFIADPNREHNDPTPYPKYNFKELKFTVETYYAVIENIYPEPSEVNEGDWFNVVIAVAYKFPGSATLEIIHSNNATMPPVSDTIRDAVTGSGVKEYTFKARAPSGRVRYINATTYSLQGQGLVRFDKGAGWQHTDPGWLKFYNISIRRPNYYAVIDSMTAEYLSVTGGRVNASIDRIQITLHVRYFLPIETGLRIVVTRSDSDGPAQSDGYGSTWWTYVRLICIDENRFTQDESVERTATYTFEYTFPIGSIEGTINLNARVEYMAYGGWNYGDEESTGVTVPFAQTGPTSIGDYIMAAFERIGEWFKKFFRLD